MKKNVMLLLMFLGLLVLSGCGSDNVSNSSTDTQTTDVVNTSGGEIVVNDTNFTLSVGLVKQLDSSYGVVLSDFSLSIEECNPTNVIFSPSMVTLNGGVGSSQTLIVSGELDANCSTQGYQINATRTVTQGSQVQEDGISISYEAQSDDVVVTPTNGFLNATTPLQVTQPSQEQEIKVQLVKNGNIATEQDVKLLPFDSQYGGVSSYTATTQTDGYATFNYTAPSILPADGTSTTLQLSYTDEDNSTITQNIVLRFNNTGTVDGVSAFSLINESNLTISSVSTESQEIAIQLVNNGVPQVGATVIAKSIPASFGYIESVNVTTGDDGYARFAYFTPSSLTNGSVELEIYYDDSESGERISKIVTITVAEESPSLPTIVIPNDSLSNTLTVNSQLVTIDIKVFAANTNSPYSEGTVKVELPQKVLDGVDIGSFVSYEVNITNGVATFEYTGPNDLQSLVDSGDLNSTFSFYHIDNSSDKKEVVMVYEPDADNGYIPVNYELTVGSEDGEFTMGLVQEKTFNVVLKDDQGTQVPDANITSITIETKNSFIGKLLDNGTEEDNLTHIETNPVNFSVRTNTKSGLLPIDIVVNFSDANNNAQELNQTINIVVYSGPPTAMSISYAGVDQDEARAKYIEKFAVTVVDTYNNKVNTQPNISVGAIVEYAVDGNTSSTGERNETSDRLWYGGNDADLGSVIPIVGDEAEFNTTTNSNIFRWVDFDNDKLVVFGVGYVYEALGKWDIAQGGDNASLELLDNYFGTQRDNLYYAVGHNNRQDLCADDGREYVGAAKSDTYQIDSEGTALVEFEYDYHLTGKDIMLWVNLDGYQADTGTNTRIGEARKHTLRGNGLVSNDSYIITASSTVGEVVRFNIEHENADEWYKNGHFGFSLDGLCKLLGTPDWSNYHDARECYNGGTGITYVDLNLSISSGTTCTATITNIVVADEF